MKTLRPHQTILFLILLTLAVWNVAAIGQTQDLHTSLLPLKPMVQDRYIAQTFAINLENHHISQRKLDANVSKEALRLFIKGLDPRKMFFYQSDIDEFKNKYETKLCALLKQTPVDVFPAFEIYNRYLDRLKERVEMVQKILSAPLDYTVNEEFVYDKANDFTLDDTVVKTKGLQTFPKTPEEAYERWRKRIKGEILEYKFDTEYSKKEREKAIAEGKEPPEVDERDPIERVQKRYVNLQRRMCLEGKIESVDILNNVRREANDGVLEKLLNSIAGALDPHSSYMGPSTMRLFDDEMTKSFQGIGATLSAEDDGYIVIRDIVTGSPAEKSGLHPKDKIQGVGQGKEGKIEEVIDFNITDVVKLIRGPKDSMVRLDILPGGKAPSKVVEIVRDEITLDSKATLSHIFDAGKKADGTPYKIGLIELPDFYLDMDAVRRRDPNPRSATADTKKILAEFVEQNVDAVVLDLRFNGGGSLQEAIELSGLFLGAGVVVQTKDESSSRPQPRANVDPSCAWTGELVVLTNKWSASASEIFAGAIKEYRRGLIVGDTFTLGKGTVQQVINLSDTLFNGSDMPLGAAKITIQGFYKPSGTTSQGIGVPADIVLPSFTDVMENVTESELDNVLQLRRVEAARFTTRPYVTPQIIAELKRRSDARIKESEDFAKLLNKIVAYKESRAKRSIPLNEEVFMEERNRISADTWEREELEDLFGIEKKIKRDFYLDEAFAIAVDYLTISQEMGIAYPKERVIKQQRSWFSSLGF